MRVHLSMVAAGYCVIKLLPKLGHILLLVVPQMHAVAKLPNGYNLFHLG